MANLKNLPKLINDSGQTIESFGKRIYPHMKSVTKKERIIVKKQIKQLLNLSKGIKFETLKRISEETGADYNKILNYEERK